MEDKKTIRVRLSTLIFIFIIFILLLVIFGMWFYYNNLNYKPNNSTITNSDSNIATNNTNTNISNNNISTENSFKLGNHYVQSDETPLNDGINTSDCEISFLENNTFTAYIGWGNAISGTYKISDDNIIECTVNTAWGEYSPKQETYAKFSFKINSNSEIEILDASEFYQVKVTNLNESGQWVLTDENKDMSLGIEKGIKFVLSE